MKIANENLLPNSIKNKLKAILYKTEKYKKTIENIIEEANLINFKNNKISRFTYVGEKFDKVINKHIHKFSNGVQVSLRQSVMAKLALKLPPLIRKSSYPEEILELYPGAFKRLSMFLESRVDINYNCSNDFFCKDIRFVLNRTIPCGGAQVVDLKSPVRLRYIISQALLQGNLIPSIKLLHKNAAGPWFRIHTESRYYIFIKEFNEEGWDKCYKRIAKLLEKNKYIRGMVGTSWFYDPQLLGISPHLAYLQNRPLNHKAFRIRHGTGPIHTQRAILNSKTRRKLYQNGEYTPVCYSIYWPRKSLLAWSKSNQNKDIVTI